MPNIIQAANLNLKKNKHMNKIKLSLALLTVISVLLWIQFPESYANVAFVVFAIFFSFIHLTEKPKDDFTQVLRKRINDSPKVLNELKTFTDEELEKLAKQVVRDIGSDTQCIKLRLLKKE